MVEAGGTWAGSCPSGSAFGEPVGSTEIAVREYPPGEDEIIAAFLKDLNQKRGAHYAIIAKPDAVERNRPAVDYIIADPELPPKIAVEVSRTWRSEEAAKEDADWCKWVQRVSDLVRGQVPGAFRIATPMTIPTGFPPEPFAADLIVQLCKEQARLAALHLDNNKGAFLTIQGIEVFVTHAGDGSDLSASRRLSNDEGRKLPRHFERLLERKSGKLGEQKQAGRQTWLVVYNTFWTAMSPHEVREIVLQALSKAHDHIDHVGIVSGDPRTMRGSRGFDSHAAGFRGWPVPGGPSGRGDPRDRGLGDLLDQPCDV